MDLRQKNEMMRHCLQRQLGSIRAADSRIALIIGVNLALTGAILIKIPDIGPWPWDLTTAIPLLNIALFLASLISAFLAYRPRRIAGNRTRLWFDGIARLDQDEFVDLARNLSDEAYFEDLARQCHVNASIAAAKFSCISWAMHFLLAGGLMSFLSLGILYILRSQ
jgi:hypothetical protein